MVAPRPSLVAIRDAAAPETMDLYRELLDRLGAVVREAEPDARRFVGHDTVRVGDPTQILPACMRSIATCTVERLEYRGVAPEGGTR